MVIDKSGTMRRKAAEQLLYRFPAACLSRVQGMLNGVDGQNRVKDRHIAGFRRSVEGPGNVLVGLAHCLLLLRTSGLQCPARCSNIGAKGLASKNTRTAEILPSRM